MNNVNLLLFRGSPRSDIINVETWNDKLPCDLFIVRFVAEFHAYKKAREFFMEHKEYTHLVIATDDIVVQPRHVEKLQKDLEEHDFPVLSGYMNVDQNDTQNMNICYKIGMKQRRIRQYKWIQKDDLPDEMFIDVEFAGFGLTAIRRDIIEGYPVFAADKVFDGFPPHRGASLDFVFCWHCKDKGIPVKVDTDIQMKHLRASGTHKVGKKHPKVEHWVDGQMRLIEYADLR